MTREQLVAAIEALLPKRLMDVNDMAQALGTKKGAVYMALARDARKRSSTMPPPIHMGPRRTLWVPRQVAEWLADHTAKP